jgi:hypothetical protein
VEELGPVDEIEFAKYSESFAASAVKGRARKAETP